MDFSQGLIYSNNTNPPLHNEVAVMLSVKSLQRHIREPYRYYQRYYHYQNNQQNILNRKRLLAFILRKDYLRFLPVIKIPNQKKQQYYKG